MAEHELFDLEDVYDTLVKVLAEERECDSEELKSEAHEGLTQPVTTSVVPRNGTALTGMLVHSG